MHEGVNFMVGSAQLGGQFNPQTALDTERMFVLYL